MSAMSDINSQWQQLAADDKVPFDDYDEDEPSFFDNPRTIYDYLKTKVYKQDDACRAAAIILWNHLRNRECASRNVFCGPSGCGKTYIWQIIKKELYPHIVIYNAADMTKSGWSGSNKVSSPLYMIDPNVTAPYIIVLDEFDKLCRPQFSHDSNVSADIQSEMLALISPSSDRIRLKTQDGERILDISKITWVLCGSFAEAAENEAQKERTSGLGFGAVKNETKAFTNELTLQNLIEFGVIPELAGRITRLINLRPLTASDYKFLLTKHPNSPLHRLEDIYRLEPGFIKKNIIKPKELAKIATDAFESGLGVRSCTANIQTRVDDYIFDNFEKHHFY